MNTVLRIAKKEFGGFFSSPIAFIFIGVFLAVNLFIFFWVETFFSTNISEVRPLFKWMPILLIFLTGAVTMRLWAEERRSGTLEFLLTSPVKPSALVFGKFLACLALVIVSLILTLPLPISVSFMGPLDWGPVWGGYLATIFLAAAYIAVGLFVSVKSDNQIVSLIITTLVCSLFYLLGSEVLVSFFANRGAQIMQLLGSGSRFDSITRGILDFRDFYYYLTIMGVFLCLNVYGLEKIRWANNPSNSNHLAWRIICGLVIANFIAANFWLLPMGNLRTDLTQGNIYSISEATKGYLKQLKEPLLIRGYFSPQTHPLLAPLVPRIRDLVEEYAVAGGPKVHVEFINPQDHPELEQEAGQKYGIRPVPFQTASKYQSSVTNSYFDLLIQYGDQFETLSFRDLIEVKVASEQELDVELRNPEYDITRAIKKVLFSYQGGGDLFANISRSLTFTGYMSADAILPEELISLKGELRTILEQMQQEGQQQFSYGFVDPDADQKAANMIQTEFGFQPMAASLFDDRTFWYYMTLASGEQIVEIPLTEDLSGEGLKRSIEAGLKRFSSTFTKTVALVTPQAKPPMPQYGMMGPQGPQFNLLREILSKEHTVTVADLDNGRVSEQADILLVVAPEALSEKQLFGIDQFLMQGGTVILAASPFKVGLERDLSINRQSTGLDAWLVSHGLTIEKTLVMDPQNSAFPVPVQRQVGAFTVQETKMVNYPYFVDIRADAMNKESGLLGGLNQLTMNWASPIIVDEKKNESRKILRLLESSEKSWVTREPQVQPNFDLYGEDGFAPGKDMSNHLLGIVVEGKFTSYFADKPSPLLLSESENDNKNDVEKEEEEKQIIFRQIAKSPDSARIILLSSSAFLSDTVLSIGSSMRGTEYLGPVQLVENAVDWSLEDRGLLEIRGRSHFSRTLFPMTKNIQIFWEYVNYGLAFLGLVCLWVLRKIVVSRAENKQLLLLKQAMGRM